MARERELKIVIDDPLAGLADLAGGSLGSAETRHIEDVYHDAPDLRLARFGVTLRWREGDGWTVKLPIARTARALDRHELVIPGDAGWVPDAARALVAGYLRTAELVPVATFSTTRTARPLLVDGVLVAEVTDDDVRADTGPRPGFAVGRRRVRFRELEIELAPDADDDWLDRIAGVLPSGLVDGSTPPMPKLVRALGDDALAPADVAQVAGRPATVESLVARALAVETSALLAALPLLRIDADATRPVHRARVATRRLRATLRAYGPLLDPSWAEPLRVELGWLAAELGRLRDLDVIGITLAEHDWPDGVRTHLDERRREVRRDLLVHLVDGRAIDLYDALVDAAAAPRMIEPGQPTDRVARQVVAPVWKALRRSVARLDALADGPTDDLIEAHHEVRIRAKRVRYASDAVLDDHHQNPRDDEAAASFSARARRIQNRLGPLNDAATAAQWLADAAPAFDPESAFWAGRMVERLERDALAELGDWRSEFEAMRAQRGWWKR